MTLLIFYGILQRYRSLIHNSRFEVATASFRSRKVVPRRYGRWRTAEQPAHGALFNSCGTLRHQHVSNYYFKSATDLVRVLPNSKTHFCVDRKSNIVHTGVV